MATVAPSPPPVQTTEERETQETNLQGFEVIQVTNEDINGIYEEEEEPLPLYEHMKLLTARFIDAPLFSGFMMLATFYALYGEDIRLSAFTKAADVVFYSLTVIALFCFALELSLASWAKQGFLLSFFWWLDLVATVSLVADVPWFVDPITQLFESAAADDGNAAEDTATATRAGRAARAGTRAGRIIRIVRVVRVVRLVRVLRLLKYAMHYRERRLQQRIGGGGTAVKSVDSSSQTGRILSEQITKQTVIGVLVFILVFPFLNVNEVYSRIDYQIHMLLDVEDVMIDNPGSVTREALSARLVEFWHALRVQAYTTLVNNPERIAFLRNEEMENITFPALKDDQTIVGVFDVSYDLSAAALFSIGFTSFIILMLGVAAYSFNRVANIYCIQPIESIMKMMREFSANPLDKMKTAESGQAETSQLVQSISKIGALLQIGFGEAGAAIIGSNLSNGGDINPMVPGRKMVALFGFVVIFHFTDTTEALREGVMLYVNRIAALVHACVHEFAGAINKNIGEAFLMVWPLDHRTEKRAKALNKRRSSISSMGGSLPASPTKSPLKGRFKRNSGGNRSSTESPTKTPHHDRVADPQPPGTQLKDDSPPVQRPGPPRRDGSATSLTVPGGSPAMLHTQTTDESTPSTPGSTPPGTPARVGVRVDSRVGVPRTPVGNRSTDRSDYETERIYVLPPGTQSFTTADCAVAGFALCVLLIKANKQLQQLCQNEHLQKLHPGFAVQTGYGLHMGWAIEGAIGSDLKVDASYLSPNVNLASRLEAATKQYHVRLLISEQVYSIMSPPCQSCLRRVDRVTVKGSARPITLYTLDISEDEENVRAAEKLDPTLTMTGLDEERDAAAVAAVRRLSTGADGDDLDVAELDEELLEAEKEAYEEMDKEARTFKRTAEVFKLKRTTGVEFMAVWDEARERYLGGDWKEAHRLFAKGKAILPDDGPTETLMSYIERRDLQPPSSWNGVRELTSK